MSLHLGAGVAFPFSVDDRGAVALAHDEEDVRQAVCFILVHRTGRASDAA